MKKLCLFMSAAYVAFTANNLMYADEQPSNTSSKKTVNKATNNTNQNIIGAEPYTQSPLHFTAENHTHGLYYKGNGTKNYSGKAFIGETIYIDVVAIKKTNLNKTESKKAHKHKTYLGVYIDPQTDEITYLYGTKKEKAKMNLAPDRNVITQIAIQEDFGPGE